MDEDKDEFQVARGSGALKSVWRTMTARLHVRRSAPSWSMGVMRPWNGSGNNMTLEVNYTWS